MSVSYEHYLTCSIPFSDDVVLFTMEQKELHVQIRNHLRVPRLDINSYLNKIMPKSNGVHNTFQGAVIYDVCIQHCLISCHWVSVEAETLTSCLAASKTWINLVHYST